MTPFIGQIQAFGFNFAPVGWALCSGQLISIPQNEALFSLLGTIYGGDGRTTFGLPDIRGRSILHHGSGPGLSPYNIGARGGRETLTLFNNNLPNHRHSVTATTNDATLDEAAAGARFGTAGTPIYGTTGSGSIILASDSTTAVGGSQSFSIRDPYQAVSICIAMVGLYPSRH